MPRFFFVLLALAIAQTAQSQARPEPLVQQVKKSIAKGVDYLVRQQGKDGSWDHTLAQEDVTKEKFPGGSTGLAVLALLNCESVIDDPVIEQKRRDAVAAGLNYLRRLDPPNTVYARALQTMAFAEARTDLATVKANVKWLIAARVFLDREGGKKEFVGWDYYSRPESRASDASNSQYAMLALWHARQAGVEIPREVWQSIHDYYRRTQGPDGYWNYSAYYQKDLKRPSVTMTIAGLCGLYISGAELNGGREQWRKNGTFSNCGKYDDDQALAKAFQWLNSRFAADLPDKTYYHLYGLERVGRLSGFRFFGEHDWYREGCKLLVKRQDDDGSWGKRSGFDRWPQVNTSFALLFLSKGRTPVLISKLVHGNWPRREDDQDWNNDRNDIRHLTEYISREGLFDPKPRGDSNEKPRGERSEPLGSRKPVGWQSYDIMRALYARNEKPTKEDETAIVADMRQTPILYINGHNSPVNRIQGIESALIQRYVENGGFIFAEACCGDPDFDKGFKQWVSNTWPDHKLEYLKPEHPVWSSEHVIPPGDPYKLMGLDVGCRTVLIYSPQDVSCFWESNELKDGRGQLAFRLGANVVALATGKSPPLPRLSPFEVASDRPPMKEPSARGFFQVGQIRHSDNWQPAPKAMTNLMEHVHKATGLDVLVRTREIRLGEPTSVRQSKFLYMHGRGSFRVDPGHLDALRFTLEHGGLLLADACCGDSEFDASFRQFAQQLFAKEKLTRVASDEKNRDRLFSAALNNGEAITAANIKCRTSRNTSPVAMEPFVEGIKIDGRWVVLYSKYDIGCALEGGASAVCLGYDRDSALRIATAAVRYNTRP
ncbi:MAG: DUF4159 domain-containing protein [Planctomycetes bacterium]|nr:DUF4159 domain-containing protein [Planctomycetota bacterium]